MEGLLVVFLAGAIGGLVYALAELLENKRKNK